VASSTGGIVRHPALYSRDLLANGDTEFAPDQDVSVTANAKMLKEFLDTLNIDQVDLVGNDSGGGIVQIFAALYPERVRSLTLTDCDTQDNCPPEAFKPFLRRQRWAVYVERLTRCCRIRASIDHLNPWDQRMNTRNI
jgi:pimeloyl-ACP methyl ester carboxylesterase